MIWKVRTELLITSLFDHSLLGQDLAFQQVDRQIRFESIPLSAVQAVAVITTLTAPSPT